MLILGVFVNPAGGLSGVIQGVAAVGAARRHPVLSSSHFERLIKPSVAQRNDFDSRYSDWPGGAALPAALAGPGQAIHGLPVRRHERSQNVRDFSALPMAGRSVARRHVKCLRDNSASPLPLKRIREPQAP